MTEPGVRRERWSHSHLLETKDPEKDIYSRTGGRNRI
jgi:hypothetical protein